MKCPSGVRAKPAILSSSELGSATIAHSERRRDRLSRFKFYALLTLFAAGLVSAAALGFAQPARAEELRESYSALVEFVQRLEGEQPKLIRAEEPVLPDDPYSALADFVQRLEGGRLILAATQKSKTDPWDLTKPGKPVAGGAKGKSGGGGAGEPIFVGSQVCAGCHAGVIAAFGETLMGKIGKIKQGTMECENCHGPGSAHVKAGGGRGVGGINGFNAKTAEQIEENNAICLNCHNKGDRTLWQGSTHEERGLACTNCHTVMKNVSRKSQLKTVAQMDTCFQCHKNKRAEIWRTSHMPVREGKMTCTSCHNPHGSFSESLLKEATVNDTCYKCHAEKRGPFLWEHPPVRESCLNCHDPHGSNNDFLLKISRPRLCQQCHSGGQHNSNPRNPFNTLYAQNRECQHCHSNHHGSNNPAGPRFMR